MSEREDTGSSQGGEKDGITKSAPQNMPSGSRSISYMTEPLQFRVQGSTITGASPPKFVSLEDIMKAAYGMQNMVLAHEIAMDTNFKLEPFEPPDNSYQKLVKETMHKAYFDILREQLNADPPEYTKALVLLQDVKQGLFSILLPRHTRIRAMIEEVLDADFIRQQAENDSLDFPKYAAFVIDLMAKLAAPARDEMIQNISQLTDTVEIFRAILEALEVLKLDLANTMVAMIRPHVQKESVLYERAKFDEMLKVSEDGLKHTREWLQRHIDKSGLTPPVTDPMVIKNVTAQTLAKAYLELLEWDGSHEYPETMQLDAARFSQLGGQVFRLQCVAAAALAAPAPPAAAAPPAPPAGPAPPADEEALARHLAHKLRLKDKLAVLLDSVENDAELEAALPSVAEEVVSMTEQLLVQLRPAGAPEDPVGAPEAPGALDAATRQLIRDQIIQLKDPEHRVRKIVRQRIFEFLKMILVCSGGNRQIPVGLSAFTNELTAISGTLLRYVMHNKAVFTAHYIDLVTEELSKT